ncbi:hypothetical protein [Kingella negevensis]|uniref:Prokaryotic cytochrome C oxidase subunit IV n=2 Tax=Kingella negevensis TaxID=1522312 RepID=A0A238HFL9_9NEIS|nr:hypothetical protein [Kingella negevensis]MDK4688340.1 hypothetical protein [Kingella negevensis]MDK4696279.1 hypothetical protein [Kingella negevensis]WII91960.1 hypothetical protein QEO93_05110 [Kingella negevensis]WII92296.1 hypothetical protein QEO94_06480 [Kingella negevensis]SNB61003.1 Uncharacterised protein [Kingella negevensis]
MLKRWLIVCLTPLLLVIWFAINPAQTPTDYLINGIVMACAAAFLFKYVLFAAIWSHLKRDLRNKQHALWQFVPLGVFIGYIVWYFMR